MIWPGSWQNITARSMIQNAIVFHSGNDFHRPVSDQLVEHALMVFRRKATDAVRYKSGITKTKKS
jgi:hypothetical protein